MSASTVSGWRVWTDLEKKRVSAVCVVAPDMQAVLECDLDGDPEFLAEWGDGSYGAALVPLAVVKAMVAAFEAIP